MAESILFLLLGALAGALFTRLLLRPRLTRLASRLRESEQTLNRQTVTIEVQTTQLAEMRKRHEEDTFSRERAYRTALDDQQRSHAQALAGQQQRFDETMAKVTAQMEAATAEMLRRRQAEFTEASGHSLGQIVTPLRETIERMKQTMAEGQHRQSEDSGTMKAIIQQMMQQSEAARRSTDELTRVFRHSNSVQGAWGETVLDELLEGQGLTRGIHYDLQPTMRDSAGQAVTDDHGSRLRPDVILHLDHQREVIIDSKVSLAAYMDYVNAATEADRQRHLAAHVASVRDQVNRLATKDYSAYIAPPKVRMDYVIMFVPHSGALWTALHAQPDLWRKAMERGVYIADEQTLFAALRIVSLTWRHIRQAENHEKVFALASEMMDRVGQFVKKYQAVGAALAKAQQAYDEGDRKLQPSGQSILQTCSKLLRLGAKQSEKNPLPFLDAAEDAAPHALP